MKSARGGSGIDPGPSKRKEESAHEANALTVTLCTMTPWQNWI